jgi:hypothetical protein
VYLSSDAGGYCARRRLLITMEHDFMFSTRALNGTLNEDRSCPASSDPLLYAGYSNINSEKANVRKCMQEGRRVT